jgi:hypothetical protein
VLEQCLQDACVIELRATEGRLEGHSRAEVLPQHNRGAFRFDELTELPRIKNQLNFLAVHLLALLDDVHNIAELTDK